MVVRGNPRLNSSRVETGLPAADPLLRPDRAMLPPADRRVVPPDLRSSVPAADLLLVPTIAAAAASTSNADPATAADPRARVAVVVPVVVLRIAVAAVVVPADPAGIDVLISRE